MAAAGSPNWWPGHCWRRLRPELGQNLQPLGGEYAGTRELLASVPFAPGYGVEIGILIDTYDMFGIDAIAQVNLGCADPPQPSVARTGTDEPAGGGHAAGPLRCAGFGGRADPVHRRRRGIQ